MIVDAWAQHPNRYFLSQPWLSTLLRWTGQESGIVADEELTLDAMDRANVDVALLSAWCGPEGFLITNDEVSDLVRRYSHRFRGVATADIRHPVSAVQELRRCVSDLGFVAVRVVPWLWDLPPNDRLYYPIYTACVELGVPVCTQIGHTGPLRRSEPGRPIPYLDDVLLDFPDLVVVGGHVGYPWIDEVLSLATKYPNFFIDTSAYAVHRLPGPLVDFMRNRGRDRVLFGTNWPMLDAERALSHINELQLDPEALDLFLGGNARRVFQLDDSAP